MNDKRPCVSILASGRNGTLISVLQGILPAALGNTGGMLPADLLEIAGGIGSCLLRSTQPWSLRSAAKSASRNRAVRRNWS
jgi:hypothetical protein